MITMRRAAFAIALTLVVAACADDDPTDDAAATGGDAAATGGDAMPDMDHDDMDGMNMGDPDATRADEVDGAALASGGFDLLDTRPEGYDDLTGTAWIARHPGGTTVTVELDGLLPDTDYISHVHEAPCAENGGNHYQYEVGGSELPPNEIHLAFTSNAEGSGFMTAENAAIASLDAVALVVHPTELIDNKVACVDFVEEEPGAAAAAIEAGVEHDMEDDS